MHLKQTLIYKTLLLIPLLGIILPGYAQSRDTLNKIATTKNLVMAVRENSIPFSYNDGNNHYIGYSVELCEMIAKQIRRELKMPLLDITYLPVDAGERMDVVKNGIADMECGVTTNTGERGKKYGFSLGIIAVETRFLAPLNLEIASERDLKGKKVAVTKNSLGETYIKELNDSQKLGIQSIQYKDSYETFSAVMAGTADLMINDDVLLASLIASTPNANKTLHLTGRGFNPNTYGIVLPKEDIKFKQMVDRILRSILISNKIMSLYKKWLLDPIPPNNSVIGLAPTVGTLDIFKSPHDRALIEK